MLTGTPWSPFVTPCQTLMISRQTNVKASVSSATYSTENREPTKPRKRSDERTRGDGESDRQLEGPPVSRAVGHGIGADRDQRGMADRPDARPGREQAQRQHHQRVDGAEADRELRVERDRAGHAGRGWPAPRQAAPTAAAPTARCGARPTMWSGGPWGVPAERFARGVLLAGSPSGGWSGRCRGSWVTPSRRLGGRTCPAGGPGARAQQQRRRTCRGSLRRRTRPPGCPAPR